MHDAVKKGLMPKGEKSGLAKLTDVEVVKIRTMYKSGKYFYRELARMFHVTVSNVYMIINRRSWKHL